MHTALFSLFVSATVVNVYLDITNQLDDKCIQTLRPWAFQLVSYRFSVTAVGTASWLLTLLIKAERQFQHSRLGPVEKAKDEMGKAGRGKVGAIRAVAGKMGHIAYTVLYIALSYRPLYSDQQNQEKQSV